MKVIDISPTPSILLLILWSKRIDCVFLLCQESADEVKKLNDSVQLSLVRKFRFLDASACQTQTPQPYNFFSFMGHGHYVNGENVS